MSQFFVAWGNGNTGRPSGTVSQHASHEEAVKARDEFIARHADNPAVGAWVAEPCHRQGCHNMVLDPVGPGTAYCSQHCADSEESA